MRKTRCLTWDRSNSLGLLVAARARFSGRTPASPAAPATVAALATNVRRLILGPDECVCLSVMDVSRLVGRARQELAGAVGPAVSPGWARPVTSAILLLSVSAM